MRKHAKFSASTLALLISANLIGCNQPIQVDTENRVDASILQETPTMSSSTESNAEETSPFMYFPGDLGIPHTSLSAADLEFDQSEIQNELTEVAAKSTEFLSRRQAIESTYEVIFDLSQDDKHALLKQIGQLGFVAADSRMDMCNPEEIRTFYHAYEEKTDAQAGVYTFDGQLGRTTFLCRNGIVYKSFSHIRWTPDMEPIIDPIEEFYKIDVFMMTPKGYLFYGTAEESTLRVRTVDGFRVEPLGDENRRLCREYIDPLNSYASTSVFSTDWDSLHLELVHLNDVFEFLYQKDTRMPADKVFTASYHRGSVYPNAVPAEEFEAVITKYFPISPEQLRELTIYDPDQQVYAFVSLMHPDASPDWEVVGCTKNEDGSVSIVVDAVSPPHLMDRVVSNTVTILPKNDGSYWYLSNQLVRFDGGIQTPLPTFQEYRPRVEK